jgi:hypothetical protein
MGVLGKDEVLFTIPIRKITVARQSQQGIGLPTPKDQFVEVDMRRGNAIYTVRFKALGMTRQKDAFNLYGAINAARARTASE